jgi:hypothetical protein
MADPTGETDRGVLRLDFDRRLMLQFRGSTITSDAGLLAYRELDDALHLTDTAANTLADARTGKNGRHRLEGLLRQALFGRLAGYEDMNDAERLCRDPAMRWVVGDRAIAGFAASASQMGRFETKWLCRPENLAALADLSGQWIDKVRQQRPPKMIVLDMDSSESPTYACTGRSDMVIRIVVTAAALLLAGFAFWDGTLGGGHILNPFGIMFLCLAGAVWFGWKPFRASFLAAKDESSIPIIRLENTAIEGLGSMMRPTPPARRSPSA